MRQTSHLILFVMVTFACVALPPSSVLAKTGEFQWSTRITLSEQYDDNIDLAPDDEEDDWITTVGPGLTLAFLLEETEVRLDYDLYFSYYAKNDENNNVRHSLTLTGLKGIPVAENVTLDLDESFRVSEDPVEVSEQTSSTRRSRERYYYNDAGVRVNYLFGEEDFLYVGSRHLLLINDESDLEDSQELRAEAGIAYWFTIRHGVSLDYQYARAEFDDSDDYDKHSGRFTYRYRFSPRV
ncbi:MAG: outer membrane beta-barrel protein, partial [bacterium]